MARFRSWSAGTRIRVAGGRCRGEAAEALTTQGGFVLLELAAARPCKVAGLAYNSVLHGSQRGLCGSAVGDPGDAGVAQLVEHDVANVVVVG